MTSIQLTLTLPDDVAKQAKAANLLNPETITALIEQELERQNQVDQLFRAMDRLANVEMRPLTESEIEVEVDAARHARRA
ncbi:MAG: hypothetical protein KF770_04605 [Anaerolineae bacterium]|nr:hypothetical protein [Anaerolineae bacterium]